MKKNVVQEEIQRIEAEGRNRIVRIQKHERQKSETNLDRNRGIIGESIETMLERIREGEGEDSISDRDLVYNDGESATVNPLTNIRSDRMELMLEEKMGEYAHKHRTVKMDVVKEKDKEEVETPKGGEATGEQK